MRFGGWTAWPVRAVSRALVRSGEALRRRVVAGVGGPARARVILLFGAVLALSGADATTVGAVAPQLEPALHIGNTEIGLLSSVALLVGAVFVLPVGLLVDRVKRIPLLGVSVVLWSVASLASAFTGSYFTLLLARLGLGAVNATAGPAIASLTGDYFAARERGRVYGYILGGEIGGSAIGFLISGALASAISWRAPFVLLAVPGFLLARTLWRTVPEPARGGQSRLLPGATSLAAAPPAGGSPPAATGQGHRPGEEADVELAHAAATRRGIRPAARLVLKQDPREMTLAAAVRYILRVPTNVLLIVASSLGYFFFAGLETFALLFIRGHYQASQASAELVLALLVVGALVGTLTSGRITDMLLRRGMIRARVLVPAGCYLGAVALLVPGFLSSHITPGVWFDVGGAALLTAANPPLDAARLDIMPAGLWGRAESTRSFLRTLAQALAPVLFGGLASLVAGFAPRQAPIGTHTGAVPASTGTGLEVTFLTMLAALAAAGIFLARARHTYPRDVATAAASRQTSRNSATGETPWSNAPAPARRVDQAGRPDVAAETSCVRSAAHPDHSR